MVDIELLGRLRALADRRRWVIGLWVSGRCRWLAAALVAAEGRGLDCRPRVFAYRRAALPAEIRRLFARLRSGRRGSAGDAALLAAQLAECQAALVDELAAEIAPVWNQVLAVAVDGPGCWRRSGGLTGCLGLCDPARLAELCGQNVIEGFAGRDLAQDGQGRPLWPLPYWILLHDVQRNRAVVEWGRTIRVTHLPASRDATGAARVRSICLARQNDSSDDVRAIIETSSPHGPVEEWILSCPALRTAALRSALLAQLPQARVLTTAELGILDGGLRPAGVAVLGFLNLDQVPANVTAVTGARTPRVLGRITPGSLASWHRLVRELAAARPSVMALRSAV